MIYVLFWIHWLITFLLYFILYFIFFKIQKRIAISNFEIDYCDEFQRKHKIWMFSFKGLVYMVLSSIVVFILALLFPIKLPSHNDSYMVRVFIGSFYVILFWLPYFVFYVINKASHRHSIIFKSTSLILLRGKEIVIDYSNIKKITKERLGYRISTNNKDYYLSFIYLMCYSNFATLISRLDKLGKCD